MNNKSNDLSDKERIISLMDKLEIKEKEITDIKSRMPYELKDGEKLMTVIFATMDNKFHYSVICKNTDKFIKIEGLLYEAIPE